MSDAKREELRAAGRIDADGNRIERCPTCGALGYVSPTGEGVATPDAVVAGVTVPE